MKIFNAVALFYLSLFILFPLDLPITICYADNQYQEYGILWKSL